MRKPFVALAMLTSLAFVSACGTSGGSDSSKTTDAPKATTEPAKATTTTTEASDAVAVDEWAKGFCGDFSTWLDAIKTASDNVAGEVTPGDVESGKTAIANLFASASEATQTFMGEIEDGGAPDIDDGDQLVDDLIAKFQSFDDAAQQAKSDAENLASTDAAGFQTAADDLTTTFQDEVNKVADSFSEIDTKYPSPELSQAISSSCTF